MYGSLFQVHMCACLVHSVTSAARMSAQLSFGMPLRQILYATCWIVTAVVFVKNIHFMSICGIIRLYVMFLDRQFSNELASLDTHPRRSLSALLIPFCCIVFYVFIHVRCDSHMSLVMRSSFQVCLPPCMCIWNTDFYFVFCFCRRRSVTHRACQPCISILMS